MVVTNDWYEPNLKSINSESNLEFGHLPKLAVSLEWSIWSESLKDFFLHFAAWKELFCLQFKRAKFWDVVHKVALVPLRVDAEKAELLTLSYPLLLNGTVACCYLAQLIPLKKAWCCWMDRKISLGFFSCHLSLSLTIVIYSVVQEAPLEVVKSGQSSKKIEEKDSSCLTFKIVRGWWEEKKQCTL